jgi:hypothetical protein
MRKLFIIDALLTIFRFESKRSSALAQTDLQMDGAQRQQAL